MMLLNEPKNVTENTGRVMIHTFQPGLFQEIWPIIHSGWGVDSKSEIHFFRPALENPDNPEKTNFSGLSRFSGV